MCFIQHRHLSSSVRCCCCRFYRATLPCDRCIGDRKSCLSVSHSRALWQNKKKRTTDILIPQERVITLVFWHQEMLKFAVKFTHPLWKRRLRPISAYNVSIVRASEKVQLSRIGCRTRAFQWAIDEMHTLPLIPQRVAQKRYFAVLQIKLTFSG